MQKKALITGIAGQDGSYLAKLLLCKGYRVHGITRKDTNSLEHHKHLGIDGACHLHHTDVTNLIAISSLVNELQPEEIYHLAAQSSVAESFKSPYPTIYFNTISTLTLLEAIRTGNAEIKFFHASSSEIYGNNPSQPLAITSPINPTTPYGVSKASAHLMVKNYRKDNNLYAINGVLFPHESPLRHAGSFTKSLIRQALAIKNGRSHPIILGQIENKRDFGNAQEYVLAMWLALQAEMANDYVIGTGVATSIKSIAEYVCAAVGIPYTVITTDSRSHTEPITTIIANPTEASKQLDWSASDTIYATIDSMILFEKMAKPIPYDS